MVTCSFGAERESTKFNRDSISRWLLNGEFLPLGSVEARVEISEINLFPELMIFKMKEWILIIQVFFPKETSSEINECMFHESSQIVVRIGVGYGFGNKYRSFEARPDEKRRNSQIWEAAKFRLIQLHLEYQLASLWLTNALKLSEKTICPNAWDLFGCHSCVVSSWKTWEGETTYSDTRCFTKCTKRNLVT